MTSRNVWYIRICISAHPRFSVFRSFRSSLCFSKAWPKCTHNVNVADSHVTRSWYETLLCWTWILNLYILCILYANLSLKLRWERPDISATQEGPPSWSINASNGFGGLGSCASVYPDPTANSASLIQTCPEDSCSILSLPLALCWQETVSSFGVSWSIRWWQLQPMVPPESTSRHIEAHRLGMIYAI